MNLNKKQIIYGGLLILAIGVVFVDRVIIGSDAAGPHQASAKPTSSRPVVDDLVIITTTASFIQSPEKLIAHRLAGAAQREKVGIIGLRDGFKPTESWIGKPSSTRSVTSSEFTESDFRNKYPLMAVITTDGKSYAIVGGHTLYVGQKIKGYKLIKIQERQAVFELNETRITMTLPTEQ